MSAIDSKLKRAVVALALIAAGLACTAPAAAPPTEAVTIALPTPVPTPVPTANLPPTATPTSEPTATAVPAAVDALSTIAYQLPLTVQHVTDTTAVLFFELAAPAEGFLIVRPVDSPSEQVITALDAGLTRHQLTVESLSPGVTYEALIGLGADFEQLAQPSYMDQAWGSVKFTTPGSEGPIRVGVLGDSGFGEEVTFNLARQMAGQELDFAINTGDVVYQIYNNASAVEAYALKWYLPFEPLLKQIPLYPVVGNHDVEPSARVDDLPFYYRAFPPFTDSAFEGRNQWYTFTRQGWRFLMLDTQTFYGEAGRAEQTAWLAEQLATGDASHTVVAFHVPPYSSGNLHQGDGAPVREWSGMFAAAGIPLVLQGHSHNYEHLEADGVTYIVSGGGSGSLYGLGVVVPESRVFEARTHYVLLELHPDRIDVTATAVEGDVLDQFTIPVD